MPDACPFAEAVWPLHVSHDVFGATSRVLEDLSMSCPLHLFQWQHCSLEEGQAPPVSYHGPGVPRLGKSSQWYKCSRNGSSSLRRLRRTKRERQGSRASCVKCFWYMITPGMKSNTFELTWSSKRLLRQLYAASIRVVGISGAP